MSQFYKLLSDDLRHYDFTYHEGLNVDTLPFDPSGSCRPGGLYYTTLEHLPRWYSRCWPLIADVYLPPEARVYVEPGGTKWKADQLVLSNIRPLSEFLATLDEAILCPMLQMNGWMIKDVVNQTQRLCLAAVQQDGWALKYVRNQTPTVCLAAVQKAGSALMYVHVYFQIDAICLAAVQQFGCAVKYVQNQTDALCLEAVQQDGFALRWVRNQTEEICLAAVQQDGLALQDVRNPTEAIRRAAVAQNPDAKWFFVKTAV
jgi:hypothetical protein